MYIRLLSHYWNAFIWSHILQTMFTAPPQVVFKTQIGVFGGQTGRTPFHVRWYTCPSWGTVTSCCSLISVSDIHVRCHNVVLPFIQLSCGVLRFMDRWNAALLIQLHGFFLWSFRYHIFHKAYTFKEWSHTLPELIIILIKWLIHKDDKINAYFGASVCPQTCFHVQNYLI